MNFKMFLLALLILALGIFIYLKVQTLGDDKSLFNQTTRYTLGKYPVFRSLFALHKDGDARAEFLGGNAGIIIEVVQPEGAPLDDRTIQAFADKVGRYTGKSVKVYNFDTIAGGTMDDSGLAHLVSSYRRHLDPEYVNLFVMYVGDFQDSGQQVGKTYSEFGVVLSHHNLVELTKDYPLALQEYQLSTLLHEFGHQIGLDHNTRDGCIMNASVEAPTHALSFGGQQTPTEFCPLELDQIKALKAGL